MAEVTARGSRTISITFCEQPEGYTQTPEEQVQTYPGSQDNTEEDLLEKDGMDFIDSLQRIFKENTPSPIKHTSKTKMAHK